MAKIQTVNRSHFAVALMYTGKSSLSARLDLELLLVRVIEYMNDGTVVSADSFVVSIMFLPVPC